MITSYQDVIFVVLLAGIPLVLSALNWPDAIMKFSLIVILIGYVAGRFVSYFPKVTATR